jgi:hypothetical protein
VLLSKLLAESSFSTMIRNSYFKLWGFLQGNICVDVYDSSANDVVLLKQILQSTHKGQFFEKHVSQESWKPLYSIESENDERWKRMSKLFHKVFVATKYHKRIDALMEKHLSDFSSCHSVCRSLASLFFELLFDKELDQPDLYALASMEWRKEIAMKGVGEKVIQNEFINHLKESIPKTWFDFNEYSEMEVVSCFAQPFFISPLINITDVLASVYYCDKDASGKELVEKCMLKYPPFPILERKIGEKKHAIILVSQELKIDKKLLLFGFGPRKCPGQDLALKILTFIVERAKNNHWVNFTPHIGHMYSGRHNDSNVSLVQLFNFGCVAIKTLFKR